MTEDAQRTFGPGAQPEAHKIVDILLEAGDEPPMHRMGEFLEVLPAHVRAFIMKGMNSQAGSSTLSRSFKAALSPYRRKLARVNMEFDFLAYLLVAIRNALRPELGQDEFGRAIAGQMERFIAHIKPLAPEREITAGDIFGPHSLN